MRTLVVLMLFALPTAAAPVPKELRSTPWVGTWEVVRVSVLGNDAGGGFAGQRWSLTADGIFAITDRGQATPRLTGAYRLSRENSEIKFDDSGKWFPALGERSGEKLSLAHWYGQGVPSRPAGFEPASDRVVYTFKRIRE